jgi:hypothetical protein|tara:strand:- start:813 stop:1094 length:282 start_codon:yes stop_codon:yes gene_type:complete
VAPFYKKLTLPKVDGPFDRSEQNAHDFSFNMMYAHALEESIRLINIAERAYEKALEEEDLKAIIQKKAELDFCLKNLHLSSIAAATDVDELPL